MPIVRRGKAARAAFISAAFPLLGDLIERYRAGKFQKYPAEWFNSFDPAHRAFLQGLTVNEEACLGNVRLPAGMRKKILLSQRTRLIARKRGIPIEDVRLSDMEYRIHYE